MIDNSFETVALPFRKVLFARAFRLAGNQEDAEDLIQITYLRAYRYWGSFKVDTNCGAWLNTLLKNSFINMYRLKKISFDFLDVEHFRRENDIAYADSFASEFKTPEQEFVYVEIKERVNGIIRKMPHNLRQVTFLRIVEDYPYEKIMGVTGLPLGTVKSRIHRGRKLLQEGLSDLK